MNTISAGIKKNTAFSKQEGIFSVCAVVLMGFFTFLFLGAEYLFDNMISRVASEEKTVLAQNYALGISAAGFLLHPVFHRFCKKRCRTVCFCFIALASVLCISLIRPHISYAATLISWLVLFLFLGLLGGAVFFRAVCLLPDDRYLARMVGISYMLGILLQFVNNNLIASDTAEAIILSLFLLALVWLLIKAERKQSGSGVSESVSAGKAEETPRAGTSGAAAGILLILLVVLMTCVFSTLDNAVTLVQKYGGAADIGQWPRILLACSGLAAGFVFDIKNRKFMSLIMYCVMMLSTISIVILGFGGPFLAGLIAFYVSAGFFAVFFTAGFMELSRHMRFPALWAGMGRAVNNITAAVIANGSLALLSFGSSMAANIIVLILFVAASIAVVAYTVQRNKLAPASPGCESPDEKERLRRFAEAFSLTPREAEVLNRLVSTGDNLQVIAESLYISRRTLERHISSIYEKTGVKSRVGLVCVYNEK